MIPNDDRPAFFDRAACGTAPIEWFFPERGQDTARAKKICAACPVLELCREYGLGERHWIWGGLSERERRRVRAQRRIAGRGAA